MTGPVSEASSPVLGWVGGDVVRWLGEALDWSGETVPDGLRELLVDIEAWFGSLTTLDLVLLAAGLAALFWLVMSLRSMTRLGPIEVVLLTHDAPDGKAPGVNALTASLRRRLGTTGLLPPPEVPAGSPQTNLIAAVETSGAPQGPWVAKLLEILPEPPAPPSYKLHGTLIGWRDDAQPSGSPPPGLAYWLQPGRGGRTRLGTVSAEHEDAVERAAAEIFLQISADAVHVFPRWSRWEATDAFLAYLKGIDHRLSGVPGADQQAEACFAEAAALEPHNALPRLQLANLLEKRAGAPEAKLVEAEGAAAGSAVAVEAATYANLQAEVLHRYLDLAVERPELVTARYRASVLAAMLASTCERIPSVTTSEDLKRLCHRLAGPGDVVERLNALSDTESKAVLQQLRLLHVLFRHGRFRHRYEPAGFDRRRLRRAVAISRHTAYIRKHVAGDRRQGRVPAVRRALARVGVWCSVTGRRAAVRGWHLWLWRASTDWNAHYNAACFYALLYQRELNQEKG